MNDKSKQVLFEETAIPKAVAQLSVPAIIGCLVTILYNLADTYFVGYLNDPVQNAAVTLAAPILLAFNAVNNLFGVGSSSLMSRSLGLHDYDSVKRSAAFGIYCSLISGILFGVIYSAFSGGFLRMLGADETTWQATKQYMLWTVSFGAAPAILNVVMGYLVRAEGAALHGAVGTMSGCLLNIVLDPIFIMPWGLNMGAAGAGCATFISNLVACGYFLVYIIVKRNSTYITLRPKMALCGKAVALGVCMVGIPAAVQNLLNVTSMTILNNFAAVYGSSAVAAIGIAYKIHLIPLHATLGVSNGIMPLVGYNYASGNVKRMKEALMFTGRAMLGFMLVISVLFYVFSNGMITAFIKNETVIELGSAFLRGFTLALPFQVIDFLGVGVYQACGMGSKSLLFAVMRKIVLEIPALFLLNRLFPMYGLAYAQPFAEFVLSIAAIVVLCRIFKGLEAKNAVVSATGK
jgi:putative MATE family efflux protein